MCSFKKLVFAKTNKQPGNQIIEISSASFLCGWSQPLLPLRTTHSLSYTV